MGVPGDLADFKFALRVAACDVVLNAPNDPLVRYGATGTLALHDATSSELIVRCRALQVQARALALEPARHLLPDALDRVRGRRHGLSILISGLPGQR